MDPLDILDQLYRAAQAGDAKAAAFLPAFANWIAQQDGVTTDGRSSHQMVS